MLPEAGLLIAVGLGAGVGASLVLLGAALRGTSPGRPGPLALVVHRMQRVRAVLVGPQLVVAVVAGLVVLGLTRWPVAAAGIAALIVAWPVLFGGARAEQRAIDQLEALVVWTESLRDTISANASLEQAIALGAQPGRAPVLMQPALERLGGQIRARTPLDAALLNLAADLDVPGADLVIAALVLNVRRRGDRLKQVLTGLCTAAREELQVRRRIHAGRAGIRRAVQIIVVITLVIAIYLTAFGGAFMDPYDSAGGQLALAVVGGLFAAGFAWMRALATGQDTEVVLTRLPSSVAHASIVAALTGLSTGGPTGARAPFDRGAR